MSRFRRATTTLEARRSPQGSQPGQAEQRVYGQHGREQLPCLGTNAAADGGRVALTPIHMYRRRRSSSSSSDCDGPRGGHVDNCCHTGQDDAMSRQTMSFALPESMREYIDTRVSAGNYGNTSEYIRDLVRRDQEEQAKKRLRELIEAGLDSGPGRPRTKADQKELLVIARGEID